VESPAKAKTINKYLGKDFIVKASLGHIKDLPKRDLAVDVEHGFEPRYELIEGKKKLVAELKQASRKVQDVYLAADPDREGEAICFHLQEELSEKKKGPRIYRVMFNEITKKAVTKAFEKPGQVDVNLVDAQQARRVLDRLVGYKISPLLWDKVRRGLSAGRVQTVALRLVVEREREIRAFVAKEYWTIDSDLAAKKGALTARLARINSEAAEVGSAEASDAVVAALDGAAYNVQSVATREKRRNPVAPFITSTLQQESSRKLRFSVKRTMMLAQRLYEGVEVGKDTVGLITYMRTDSTRVSEDAIRDARDFIKERYGREFLPDTPNFYKSKKGAQDAHEAIRPTSMAYAPEQVEKYLQEDERKLYRLIWNRFVASQMMPAVYDQTTIDVAAKGKDGNDYLFRATGSVPKFEGYLKVYKEGKDQLDEEDEEVKHHLPAVTEGERLRFKAIRPEQHFTEPPPRYNEATLVKRLEADGVGRPSTYASILSTIQEREYVKKDAGRFEPTELGMVVTDLLLESFDDIFDVTYTARMEEELDEIEEGKIEWRAAMQEFYERFDKDLKHAEEHMTNIKRLEKPTDKICEKCGKPLVIKWGRHGSFLACTGYPDFPSRNAEADLEKLEKEIATRHLRRRNEIEKQVAKLRARYPEAGVKWDEPGRFLAADGFRLTKGTKAALKSSEEKIEGRRLEDRRQIELRLEKIQARYPQINEFYDLSLRDTAGGVALSWQRKESFCTYTRELTVDLPDVDKADLSEQGDEEYCENCGRPMVLKKGRFGTFYACTGYPDCKTTKPIGGPQRKPDQKLDELCPQCGNNLVLKTGRYGEFTACSNYPTCKYVKQKTIGVKCPECSEGEIAERRSKRGKTFYGCTRWPECNFVAWGKPVAEKCPECGSPYMIEKWLKAGTVWQCPNAECKHKQPAPQPVESGVH